jgi:phosphoribosylformylglycinamidine synthase II
MTDPAALAADLGLTPAEYAAICKGLGRAPNRVEVGIFAGMWSEHSSYKSTGRLLATLPREGERVLAGPGSHAGCVDVGEGWAVAFKVESHNHPSAVEPYQGAATGVGGILRDVVAQGARPCAVMDSLCFGEPGEGRTDFLVDGVVGGIAGYGNSYGVPNVGGRTVFDRRYAGNPLVNALAAGLVRHDGLRTAAARGDGNAVLYAGARTGRDGILGAAFASEELDTEHTARRSHVQVGDPFTGKKLMEAMLSFGPDDGLIACQDMGAVGITCAMTEMAAAGGVGFDVDLDRVPLREPGMDAYDILLSESQERFMLVVESGRETHALDHFRRHGVHAAVIGRVAEGGVVRVRHGGSVVAEVPARLVADGAPAASWEAATGLPAPAPYPDFPPPADPGAVLRSLLADPDVADARWITDRYDSTVGNRTVRGPGEAEAAVLKLPGSRRGFALTIENRGDACAVDPYLGTLACLGAARRDLACAGADLVAITDGINHGSPGDPVEFRRLTDVVRALGDGLRSLGIPVTGGNVSLYNESPLGPIPPTPMIGALGVVDDVSAVPWSRMTDGEAILLFGGVDDFPVLSRYGRLAGGSLEGDPPAVDLDADDRLARFLLTVVGRIRGAKATGTGGLAVALAKLCLRSGVGARISLPPVERPDWALFGEYPAQVWAATTPDEAAAVAAEAAAAGIPCRVAGTAGGGRLVVDGVLDEPLEALAEAFSGRHR